MRIDKINVMPVQNSINPELLFEIEFFVRRDFEIPVDITGSVLSDENRKIANIYGLMHMPNQTFELAAEHRRRREGEEKRVIKLIASLNQKVLDYIETLRIKDRKGDVNLTLDIFIKLVVPNTMISPLTIAKINLGRDELEHQNKSLVAYEHSGEVTPSYNNMWILSGDGSPIFIKIIDYNFKNQIVIRSSDWIHDYCPIYQTGRFSVFEYLLPDYIEGSGSIEERLNESINAIKKMEESLIRGDWNGVIEDSRVVWELLRNQDEIKDLLKRDGYTEPAFDDLNECLKKLFEFSSKFIHRLDKEKKKTMPEIRASKEDAYLIYAVSMNIINLISKKMQRLNLKIS
ncbi:MAG: hypothetical protein FIB08_09315 [Candidatus Methanoperedens sp.]|nr:hypothetical protein [Candidatus Methanoperedens sp.]